MHTLREYIRITICDLQRNSVFQQIVIVAGICLPILILLGLKNGQIKDMGDKIRQNPQACSVEIYPHPRLNYEEMMDLKKYVLTGDDSSHIQNVLPLSYPCDISMRSAADPTKEIDCVTVTPTCKGDPRAKARKADVIDELKLLKLINRFLLLKNGSGIRCVRFLVKFNMKKKPYQLQTFKTTQTKPFCIWRFRDLY